MKNDFHLPRILRFPDITGALAGESLGEIMRLFNGLDWDDVTFVREASGLPVIVKGLFSPDDAKAAIRALDHILRLRKKLESDPADPKHFHTIHGSGYKFLP